MSERRGNRGAASAAADLAHLRFGGEDGPQIELAQEVFRAADVFLRGTRTYAVEHATSQRYLSSFHERITEYLGAYDDPRAFEALVKVATDRGSPDYLLETSGESIAQIWLRRGAFHGKVLETLVGPARDEAVALIRKQRPEWLASL